MKATLGRARRVALDCLQNAREPVRGDDNPYTLFFSSRAGAQFQKANIGAITTDSIDVQLAQAFQPVLDSGALPFKLPLLDVEPQSEH